MASTALAKNPFARPMTKVKDAAATARAAGAKKLAAVTEAGKKQLVKARNASFALATKAREPLMGVAYNEGIRLAGHTEAFVADALMPTMRGGAPAGVIGNVLNIVGRPAAAIVAVSFVGAAFTKGETRLHLRENGQGALHAVWAVILRRVASALYPAANDRAMGEAGDTSGDY